MAVDREEQDRLQRERLARLREIRLSDEDARRVIAGVALAVLTLLPGAALRFWPGERARAPIPSCSANERVVRDEAGGAVRCSPDAPAGAAKELDGRASFLMGKRLDLNRASADDLTLIPGVGPSVSERIVADREARGPFLRVEDVERVKGIGPKGAAMIARYATAGERSELTPRREPSAP